MDIKREGSIIRAVGRYLARAAKALIVSKLMAIVYARHRKS